MVSQAEKMHEENLMAILYIKWTCWDCCSLHTQCNLYSADTVLASIVYSVMSHNSFCPYSPKYILTFKLQILDLHFSLGVFVTVLTLLLQKIQFMTQCCQLPLSLTAPQPVFQLLYLRMDVYFRCLFYCKKYVVS